MEILLLLVSAVIVFYIVKSIVQSVIKGVIYTALFILAGGFLLLVYMFGLEGAFLLVKGFLNL